MTGGAFPGVPGITIGRTKNFAWGVTAVWADSTDLWEEEINVEFTKYLVDGEWRDLKKITEQIKVKG